MRKLLLGFVPSLSIIVLASSAAVATPINYGNFGGGPGEVTFLNVTEDSSTDATPLFGAPFDLPNKLLFVPDSFAASSANGGTDTTAGTLTLGVRASAGEFLHFIRIAELGDYTLSGVGTSTTNVNVTGTASAVNVTPGGSGPFVGAMNFAPAPPFALPSTFDEFNGLLVLNLNGLGISEIFLTFENTLTATSEASTTSFIQKKNIAIEHSNVPEPASLALMSLGIVALLARRRA